MTSHRTAQPRSRGLFSDRPARISHDKPVGAGRCARPEALAGLGCMIAWDGVCISQMGGHGGPPLQIKSVQRLDRTLVRNAG